MGNERATIEGGANLTELRKDIKKIVDGVNSQKNKRTQINEEIAALKAKAVTMGVPKRALDWAMKYMEMEPEDRKGFDLAYTIVREAIGLPMSDDLFSAAESREKAEKETSASGNVADLGEQRRLKAEQVANAEQEQVDGAEILDKTSTPPAAPKQSEKARKAAADATGIEDQR